MRSERRKRPASGPAKRTTAREARRQASTPGSPPPPAPAARELACSRRRASGVMAGIARFCGGFGWFFDLGAKSWGVLRFCGWMDERSAATALMMLVAVEAAGVRVGERRGGMAGWARGRRRVGSCGFCARSRRDREKESHDESWPARLRIALEFSRQGDR